MLCKAGGLGCNAAGFEACRFCGFGEYTPVLCPGTLPSTQIEVSVQVAEACPRACSADPAERCFLDPACSDPLSPSYAGGLGCNAGSVGPRCRFCGFQATNATDGWQSTRGIVNLFKFSPATTGNYDFVAPCSNRGICDEGSCECFKGYTDDNCDIQSSLAV